jgi:hypothetical protein
VWSFDPFARIKSFSSEEVTLFRQENSSRCERILGNAAAQGAFYVGNHVDPHHKRKHSEAWLEIRSRYYLHSAVAAGLAAADDLAHAGDANRIAWSIFYRQERVGFGGRHFFIWKFRTMKLSAETQIHERYFEKLMQVDCPMTKLDAYGDPRLAPFGRILRASGLDELPQIFNVLCGEMSLVGPRPCTPNEFAGYKPWQRNA